MRLVYEMELIIALNNDVRFHIFYLKILNFLSQVISY